MSSPEHALSTVAPAFVEMAHRIVWCSAATVDADNRPRSRILHPIWEWDGSDLVGWVATGPTPPKRAHIEHSPFVSLSYWTEAQDTCQAECAVKWAFDDETCARVWDLFANAPEPVGYDPTLIPPWTSPDVEAFAVLRLDPWRLRVFPGTIIFKGEGELLTWRK